MVEPVVENTNVKILLDFTIQTDKKMPNNRPNINSLLRRRTRYVIDIFDVACPDDCRTALKENEKVNKNRDLAVEIKTLWHLTKVVITLIVIGALESFTAKLEEYLGDIHVGLQAHRMQKTVLLGSGRILRAYLHGTTLSYATGL